MVKYEYNSLTAEELSNFRNIVGWGYTPVYQAEKALKNSLMTVTAVDRDKILGIGRLVGDGALIWYIQDVIVLPEYQKRGIGTMIIESLLDYVDNNSLSDTVITVGLMSAKGKEAFYQKFNFRIRPNDINGAGMILNRKID